MKKELPPLKDRPVDPTVFDGSKIPQTNDGVMDDKNRPEPKEGTTGTSGGVSEKDKARKAKEGATGEKAENKPETPKEAPPLPHSEQEKILGTDDGRKDRQPKDRSKPDGKKANDVYGLEVCSAVSSLLHTEPHANAVTYRNHQTSPTRPTRKLSPFPNLRTKITSRSRKAASPPPARAPNTPPKTQRASYNPSTPSSSPSQ